MKKLIALMMVLAMMFVAVPGLAEMTEFTYVVPSTVENLEHSPFHIAQRLRQGLLVVRVRDLRVVAVRAAQAHLVFDLHGQHRAHVPVVRL